MRDIVSIEGRANEMNPAIKRALHAAALVLAYVVTARLSLSYATINGYASPVWPATGLAMGALLILGRGLWPAIALGAMLANSRPDAPALAVVAIGLGNALEAWLGATIVTFIRSRRAVFEHHTELVSAVVATIGASPFSALIGTGALFATGVVSGDAAWSTWLTWWTGDALGALVVMPMVLQLFERGERELAGLSAPIWKALVAAAVCAAACIVAFGLPSGRGLLFVLFPPLLAGAWAGGAMGTTFATATICAVSIVVTSMGKGPFVNGSLNDNLIHLELFLASVALTGLSVSGMARMGPLRSAGAVLLAGWTVAGGIFYAFDRAERERTDALFSTLVTDAEEEIRHRMTSYEDALRGGTSLIQTRPALTRNDWSRYIQTLDLSTRYPGIHGVGVVVPVTDDQLPGFEERMRRETGDPAFAVHGVPGKAPADHEHFVVTYVEPMRGNAAAIGLDLTTEPSRREAAVTARDTGKPTITRRIQLVQDMQHRPGFLLYLPIYTTPSTPDTVEERREAFAGWVYAPFISEHFFVAALRQFQPQLEARVFDTNEIGTTAPIFVLGDSGSTHTREQIQSIRLGQHLFTIQWRLHPSAHSVHDLAGASAGAFGAIITLLFASLVTSLRSIGQRAQTLADAQTVRLRASEERFALAVSGSNDGIWDWDIGTGAVYFSARWKEMLGYRDDELVNTFDTWVQLQHPDDVSRVLETLNAYLEGRRPSYSAESRLRHKDGSWRWILQRGRAVRNDVGAAVRMAGSHTDITAQREAEDRLRENERFLDSIVENLPSMVFVKDARSLRFVRFNHAGEVLLGISREELLGRSDADFFPPEQARYFVERDRVVLAQSGVVDTAEEPIQTRTHGLRLLQTRKFAIRDGSGNPLYLLGISDDITERKRAEQELIAAGEAALEGTRAKSEFLANMSHEIRTPINGIVGMGGLLASTPLTPEQRQYVAGIATSADALQRLVNDILDFSKVEAGRLELEAIDFSLPELLEGVQKTLLHTAEEKGLEFTISCDPALHPPLNGDPARLRQVLVNLVSNAIKFTTDGYIQVRATQAATDRIRLEVEDTGIGIPVEMRARLFQPFTQADASTTRRFGGTGLGLSISKRLVELMRGRIGVECGARLGTMFWVEVPLVRGRSVPARAPSPTQPTVRRVGRILVAEDNAVSQLVSQRTLERLGHEVVVVASGDEVLAALARQRFDLVFMDCQMPGRDGYETTAEIRQNEGWQRHVPIVALTANAVRGDRERCLAAGMNDYLAKPFLIAELAAMADRWLPPVVGGGLALEALEKLDQLEATSPGSDFVAEVIRMYLTGTPARIHEMREAFGAGDLTRLRAIAHSLKSSSGYVGATLVGELCRRIEEDTDVSAALLETWVTALESAYSAIEGPLKAQVAQRRGGGITKEDPEHQRGDLSS